MTTSERSRQAVLASLAGLVVLNGVLLASFFAQIQPHPELNLGPLGGAGPFIGTTIAVSVVTMLLVVWRNLMGYVSALLVVVQNGITFGPQKLFESSASLTYPAVVAGSLLTIVLLVATLDLLRQSVSTASEVATSATEETR